MTLVALLRDVLDGAQAASARRFLDELRSARVVCADSPAARAAASVVAPDGAVAVGPGLEPPEDGEAPRAVARRVREALAPEGEPEATIVIASGALIESLSADTLGLPVSRVRQDPGALTVFNWTEDGLSLVMANVVPDDPLRRTAAL